MGKKKVRVLRLDWDAEYYFDMYTGNGFTITEPVAISLDGSKQKTMYGPQSPLYGTTYGDDQAFIERYRCKCGKYKSRLFEGEICPYCHTKVEYRGSDINMTGWISLGDNRIISPFYYRVLQGALGKTVLSDIVFAKFKVTKDGHKVRPSEDEFEGKPSSPYAGIGIDAFYENYENIMEYFKSIKKAKADTIDLLIKQKSSVFVSHIPILSTLLRPQSITSDTFYYNTIDKTINPLFSLSEHIKDDIPIERDLTLARLQTTVNDLWDIIFTEINGKDGHIRGEMLGGSLNYTSRNVICPAPDLHDDEIDISYHTFLEVFKYKIIYYIMKMDDVSMSTAYSEWKASSKYNEKMHEIMQYMIQREDIRVLINRNPTLNYYSMLLMKIRQIKSDGGDYALSVPLSILPGLNADFDGDILNIIGLVDPSIVYMFRKFDPIHRMIISRDSGLLNGYFSITKGQLIDLQYFCTIGAMENDQEETYPVLIDDKVEWKTEDYIKKNNLKVYSDGYLTD